MKVGYKLNGEFVSRAEFMKKTGAAIDASCVPASIGPTEARPQVTCSSGVLPHQVPEARRVIKERGLTGVEVRPNGEVVATSRGKRGRSGMNGWMGLRSHSDQQGGLGDV